MVAGLCGDWEAAKKIHLQLPKTGVCGVPEAVNPNDLPIAQTEDFCCEEEKAVVEIEGKPKCC